MLYAAGDFKLNGECGASAAQIIMKAVSEPLISAGAGVVGAAGVVAAAGGAAAVAGSSAQPTAGKAPGGQPPNQPQGHAPAQPAPAPQP